MLVLQKTRVQDGFLLRKMDATIHSNHPTLPRVPSSMLFFSACSISKNVGTTPQPSEKKNIRQGATLRIEEEHGNLKGYDSTTTKLPVELTPLVFKKWPKGNKNSTRIKMNLDNHVSR